MEPSHAAVIQALVDSISREGLDAWFIRFVLAAEARNVQQMAGNETSDAHAHWANVLEAEAIWRRQQGINDDDEDEEED